MNANQSSVPSVMDNLLQGASTSDDQAKHTGDIFSSRGKRSQRRARPLELPRDRLAITFQKCRHTQGLSLAELAHISGIDVAHIWRIEQGERPNTSREVLIVLCMAMVLDIPTLDQVIEVVDETLDAAGLKMLRPTREPQRESSAKRNRRADETK